MYQISPDMKKSLELVNEAVEELGQIQAAIKEKESKIAEAKTSVSELEREIGETAAASLPGKVAALFTSKGDAKNQEKQLLSSLDQIRILEAQLGGLRNLETAALDRVPTVRKEFERVRSEWGRSVMDAFRQRLQVQAEALVKEYELGAMLSAACDDSYFSELILQSKLPSPIDQSRELFLRLTHRERLSRGSTSSLLPGEPSSHEVGGYQRTDISWRSDPNLVAIHDSLAPVNQAHYRLRNLMITKKKKDEVRAKAS
jgi:hypothetical protein